MNSASSAEWQQESNAMQSDALFHGVFLDGKTAVRWPVTLAKKGNGLIARLEGNERLLDPGDLLPIHPCRRGVQFLRLHDGGTCEMSASPELLALLTELGVPVKKESAVAALLHGDWRASVMALAFLVGVILAFYVWLLPSISALGASMVPHEVQRKIGETALRQLETRLLAPSNLPGTQQGAIQSRFELLTKGLTGEESKGLELLIRKSSAGPNALALPGNFVILTDELVTLVDGDLDAISGVLAHELGHLKHQHGLRSVVQATALTILGSALIGDYSAAMAAIPAALGHLNYSRQFEAEADAYSHEMLCAAEIDPARTALFFDRASKIKGNVGELIPEYLSSHPGTAERAAYFRKPCVSP